jgi:uncharacterized membrane protein YhdT
MPKIPTAISFTIAGTVPFVGLSVMVAAHAFADNKLVIQLLLTYAAVIMSFLGGIHLGVALTQYAHQPRISKLLIAESIWPSLITWGLLYTTQVHIQLLVLTILYALMWAIDSLLYNNDIIPQWFFNLRCVITPIVMVSLYVAYFGLI